MKIKYVGNLNAVNVPCIGTFKKDEYKDVTDAQAEELLRNTDFKKKGEYNIYKPKKEKKEKKGKKNKNEDTLFGSIEVTNND